ncbi:PAS domain S-box protein [bacterium]|nr:PAS domain S-box protein [bacterium]NIN91486.1 PAS domain S-box protein [bacterium]NIO72872.1 PAS domain S-box protein [bacterium]
MEEKVNQRESVGDKYRNFFENFGEGVCIVDKKLAVRYVNDKLCQTSGYSRDEFLGKDIRSFFDGMSIEIIENEFRKRVKGKSSHYVLTAKTKEGKEVFFSVCSVPLLDKNNKLEGVMSIICDYTEKKKADEKLKEHTLELENKIRERTGQLVNLYKGVADAEETSRLAQEIHDSLAQTLSSSLLNIELCEKLVLDNPGKAKKELSKLKKTLAKSIKATRNVIFELRLPRFHRTSFIAVLKQYLEEFRRKSGIAYSLNSKLEESLPAKIQVGAYRIIREAMNNIKRHSRAKNVNVRLRTDKNRSLHLVIKDDGRGFDAGRVLIYNKTNNNFGLIGMEDEAKLLGGSFAVESAKGKGTKIKVKVPLGRYGQS